MGSHLLADALAATGVAGNPREWLPRFTAENAPKTPLDRMKLVTQPPAPAPSDPVAEAAHIRKVIAAGTSENGVFGVVVHWPVLQDAVRRLHAFLGMEESDPHAVLSAAFPGLSYVWLRRQDKVAQAVSWYKAIQTGSFVGRKENAGVIEAEPLRFDEARIRYLLSAIVSFENAQASYFASRGLKPLVLYYEDLASGYAGTVRSVLDSLGLDGSSREIAEPTRKKYADALSEEWIEQFKRLQERARPGR